MTRMGDHCQRVSLRWQKPYYHTIRWPYLPLPRISSGSVSLLHNSTVRTLVLLNQKWVTSRPFPPSLLFSPSLSRQSPTLRPLVLPDYTSSRKEIPRPHRLLKDSYSEGWGNRVIHTLQRYTVRRQTEKWYFVKVNWVEGDVTKDTLTFLPSDHQTVKSKVSISLFTRPRITVTTSPLTLGWPSTVCRTSPLETWRPTPLTQTWSILTLKTVHSPFWRFLSKLVSSPTMSQTFNSGPRVQGKVNDKMETHVEDRRTNVLPTRRRSVERVQGPFFLSLPFFPVYLLT